MTQQQIQQQIQQQAGQAGAEQLPEFNPREPLFPTMTAQETLNEVLTHLMDEATGGEPWREHPDEEVVNQLAPSLKGLVMREILEKRLEPCNHAYIDMSELAHGIVALLPPDEAAALMARMKDHAASAGNDS